MLSVREEFKLELKNKFSVLSTQNEDTDIEESWKAMKMYIYVWKQVRKYWVLEKINKRNGSLMRHGKKMERRKLAKENVNRSKSRQQKISTQKQYAEINNRIKRSIR